MKYTCIVLTSSVAYDYLTHRIRDLRYYMCRTSNNYRLSCSQITHLLKFHQFLNTSRDIFLLYILVILFHKM